MEYISQIINLILSNFDFAYMLVINILTYLIVKTYESLIHKLGTWLKRVILVLSIITVGIIYLIIGELSKVILLNSTIAAPVFYSWVLKPLLDKFGIGYIKLEN